MRLRRRRLGPVPPPARLRWSALALGDTAEEGERNDDLLEAGAAVEAATLAAVPDADGGQEVERMGRERAMVERDRVVGWGVVVAAAEGLARKVAIRGEEGRVAVVAGDDHDPVALDGEGEGLEEAEAVPGVVDDRAVADARERVHRVAVGDVGAGGLEAGLVVLEHRERAGVVVLQRFGLFHLKSALSWIKFALFHQVVSTCYLFLYLESVIQLNQ